MLSLELSNTLISSSVFVLLGIAAITTITYAYIEYHIDKHNLIAAGDYVHSAKIQTQLVVAASAYGIDTFILGIGMLMATSWSQKPDYPRNIAPFSVTFFIFLGIYFFFQVVPLIVAIPAVVRSYRAMRRDEESPPASA